MSPRRAQSETDVPTKPKTPLARYVARLKKEGGEPAFERFAKRADTSPVYLMRIVRGEKGISDKLIEGIYRASGGRVTHKQIVQASPGIDRPSRVGHSTILERRAKDEALEKASKRLAQRQKAIPRKKVATRRRVRRATAA